MYRIRLTNGEESVYRTVDELARAVSSGVISPKAEVFHKSADRWLPIESHPDYRAVVTGKRPSLSPTTPAPPGLAPVSAAAATHPRMPGITPSGRPVASSASPEPIDHGAVTEPVPALELPVPEPIVPAVILMEPADPPPIVLVVPYAAERTVIVPPPPCPELVVEPPPATSDPALLRRTGRLRMMLPAVAAGLIAIGLGGGGTYVAWPRVSAWVAAHHVISSERVEGMAPEPDTRLPPRDAPPVSAPMGAASRRLDSLPTVFPAASAPLAGATPASDDSGATLTPEDTRVTHFTTTRTRLASYTEAYADARSEMDDGFDYVNFRRVFAPSRFAAPESLRAVRRTIAAAANILRVYRGREVMLEQTYRPDDPGGRGSLREPFETAEASRELLSDVDSLLGLLASQQGRVDITGESVHFHESVAARNYNQLRDQIAVTLQAWHDSIPAANRVTLPRLLRAFGGALPPPAR